MPPQAGTNLVATPSIKKKAESASRVKSKYWNSDGKPENAHSDPPYPKKRRTDASSTTNGSGQVRLPRHPKQLRSHRRGTTLPKHRKRPRLTLLNGLLLSLPSRMCMMVQSLRPWPHLCCAGLAKPHLQVKAMYTTQHSSVASSPIWMLVVLIRIAGLS
jgi:hypothetical protein